MAKFDAPWDNPFVTGQTGAGAKDIGFTEPAQQQSVHVPSAAQDASPEQGSGPQYDSDYDDFGVSGVSEMPVDATPYEPPGVAPSVAWDASPDSLNAIRGVDQGAAAYFTEKGHPDTGQMTGRDTPVPSWSRGITTDSYGRLDLADIGRPEHDIYQGVGHDMSPRWIEYEERPQFGNIAVPAPYIQSAEPSEYVPNAAYPDLSRVQNFAAEQYVTPPDPQQFIPAYASATEQQGEWE
jgi:hypothetical protein